MRDYALLAKAFRHCEAKKPCGDCPMYGECPDIECRKIAADAIEELLKENADLNGQVKRSQEEIRKLDKLLAKVPRWISVEERLPEIGEIVLAYVDELGLIIRAKIVDAKDYRGERRIDWVRVDPDPFFLSCYTITHWMPLPEAPDGVER